MGPIDRYLDAQDKAEAAEQRYQDWSSLHSTGSKTAHAAAVQAEKAAWIEYTQALDAMKSASTVARLLGEWERANATMLKQESK